MGRVFNGHLSQEMFFLWVVEFFLCFFAFYLLLLPADEASLVHLTPAWLAFPPALHAPTASHALLLSCAIGMASLVIGLYRPEICLQMRQLMLNTVVAGLLAFPAMLLVSMVTNVDVSFLFGQDAFWPVKIFLTWILLLFLPRLGFRVIMRLGLLTRNVAIIGAPRDAARIEAAIAVRRRGFFRVAAVVPAAEAARVTPGWLGQQRIWGVIIATGAHPDHPAGRLAGLGLPVFEDVDFCERHLRRMDLERLPRDWLLAAHGLSCGHIEAAARRLAEIVMSLLLLAFTLPLLLLTALLIKLDSPGPVLFRQERVGLGGRVFTIYKLRSMRMDAEAGGPAWASRNDSRVTRVGAFIRLTRIDELPQLVNVLRGEMGFVGPRPERPQFVRQLGEAIPFYHDRAYVKPGVTGWAQVNYPYGASVEDARQKLSYDLYYVKYRSLFLDGLIVLATIRVILFQEGAR